MNKNLLVFFLFFHLNAKSQVDDSLLYKQLNYLSVGYLRSYRSLGDRIVREMPNPSTPNMSVSDTISEFSKMNGFNAGVGNFFNLRTFKLNVNINYWYLQYNVMHIKPISSNLRNTLVEFHIVSPAIGLIYQYHGLAFGAGLRADITASSRRIQKYSTYETTIKGRASYSIIKYEFTAHIPLIRKENHRTFLSLAVICDADIFKNRAGYSVLYAARIETEIPEWRKRRK